MDSEVTKATVEYLSCDAENITFHGKMLFHWLSFPLGGYHKVFPLAEKTLLTLCTIPSIGKVSVPLTATSDSEKESEIF